MERDLLKSLVRVDVIAEAVQASLQWSRLSKQWMRLPTESCLNLSSKRIADNM